MTMNLLGKQEQCKGDSAEIEMDATLELARCSRENKVMLGEREANSMEDKEVLRS